MVILPSSWNFQLCEATNRSLRFSRQKSSGHCSPKGNSRGSDFIIALLDQNGTFGLDVKVKKRFK